MPFWTSILTWGSAPRWRERSSNREEKKSEDSQSARGRNTIIEESERIDRHGLLYDLPTINAREITQI